MKNRLRDDEVFLNITNITQYKPFYNRNQDISSYIFQTRNPGRNDSIEHYYYIKVKDSDGDICTFINNSKYNIVLSNSYNAINTLPEQDKDSYYLKFNGNNIGLFQRSGMRGYNEINPKVVEHIILIQNIIMHLDFY